MLLQPRLYVSEIVPYGVLATMRALNILGIACLPTKSTRERAALAPVDEPLGAERAANTPGFARPKRCDVV